jgi:transposase
MTILTKKMLEVEARLGQPLETYLRSSYVDEHKSTIKIAKELGVSHPTVRSWLKCQGIEVRTISEACLPQGFVKPSKEQLRTWYIDENKTTIEIAKELGVSHPTVGDWMNDYDIEVRSSSESRLPYGFKKPSKEKLRTWYIDEHKTITEIAEDIGVGTTTVGRWMKSYSIEIRNASEACLPQGFVKPSKEKLRTWYIDEHKTTIEIAEELGVGNPTVGNWLKDYGIEIRHNSEAHLPQGFKKPSKEQLITWYINEHKNLVEIAEDLGVNGSTVRNWLKSYIIEIRHNSEAHLPQGFVKPSKEQLITWYIDEHKSQKEIAEELGVSGRVIGNWMNDYGIGTRTISENNLPQGFKKPSEEQLRSLHVNGHKSKTEIAEELGVSRPTVARWLNDYRINRDQEELKKLEDLVRGYLEND